MKGALIVSAQLVVLLLLWSGSAHGNANSLDVGIAGSVHDLTGNAHQSTGIGRMAYASGGLRNAICRACHMPHEHAEASYGDAGISWNEEISTKKSWRMYGSDSGMLDWIDGATEPAPTGSSKLCLGCHDGITAVNQYDGRSGGTNKQRMSDSLGYRSSPTIGGTSANLTNNHPISITYAWGKDSQLRDPAAAMLGSGHSVQSLLENGRVECATCHDVHNSDVVRGSALLRGGENGSFGGGLCLTCHDK